MIIIYTLFKSEIRVLGNGYVLLKRVSKELKLQITQKYNYFSLCS